MKTVRMQIQEIADFTGLIIHMDGDKLDCESPIVEQLPWKHTLGKLAAAIDYEVEIRNPQTLAFRPASVFKETYTPPDRRRMSNREAIELKLIVDGCHYNAAQLVTLKAANVLEG